MESLESVDVDALVALINKSISAYCAVNSIDNTSTSFLGETLMGGTVPSGESVSSKVSNTIFNTSEVLAKWAKQ